MALGLLLTALLGGGWGLPTLLQPSLLDELGVSEGAGIRMALPPGLEEISGLATTPDGRLLAHDDERAIVYEVDFRDGTVVKSFRVGLQGLPGDFEGIAVAGPRIFLVTSQGELLEFREGEAGSSVRYRIHRTGVGRLCEVEGLAWDEARNCLLLPCKTARTTDFEDHLVVLGVDASTMEVYPVPRVFIPLENLEGVGLDDEFHPSAVEVHPTSGRLLLASARDEALLELSSGGSPLAGRKLPEDDHPQTEGLALLPAGRLVLADEGRGGPGRLTRYGPDPGTSPERRPGGGSSP